MLTEIYCERLTSRNIRLLELEPGKRADQIRCRLKLINLNDNPKFEALSYVWGSKSRFVKISCDAKEHFITENLAQALRRLRLRTTPRTIWTDAICINQDDIEERNTQVKLMRHIFGNATRVVVWLGPEPHAKIPDDASFFQPTLERLASACLQQADLEQQDLHKFVHGRDGYPSPDLAPSSLGTITDPLPWRALLTLFNSRWFTRTWCVQEIQLARDAVFLYGPRLKLSWAQVALGASMIVASERRHKGFCSHPLVENAYRMCIPRTYSEEELMFALHDFRRFEASDPKDKVFGILGIVGWDKETSILPVDYSKPVREVLIDAARSILSSRKDLTLLSAVETSERFYNLPSWVPSWSTRARHHSSYLPHGGHRVFNEDRSGGCLRTLGPWNVSGWKRLESWHISTAGAITIRGVRVAKVSAISQPLGGDPHQRMLPLAQDLIIQLIHRCYETKNPSTATTYLAFTLTSGVTKDEKILYEIPSEKVAYHRGSFLSALAFNVEWCICPAGRLILEDIESKFSMWDFEEAMKLSPISRRLFTTSQGHYGMGPPDMREGDIVAILFGGRVPYVLRHYSDGYVFIGTCYIHHIMHGDLFTVQSGYHLEEEDFVLH